MRTFADTVETGGKGMTALGIIAIVLGLLAMLAPGLAGISAVFLVGGFVLIGGIVRMIWAFQGRGFAKGLLMVAIGILTMLCGIVLLAHPLFAAGALTLFLALYLVIDGVLEIVVGFRMRSKSGGGWLIFSGIISILLGLMIWSQFPVSGVWAIGILLGIKLFFVGLIMLTGGRTLRSTQSA